MAGGIEAAGQLFATTRHIATYLGRVRPQVQQALAPIVRRSHLIEDPVYRQLAHSALESKRFHCQGAAVLADGDLALTQLIVCYQTLCDYLDTLTDRGPELSSQAISDLHSVLPYALSTSVSLPDASLANRLPDSGYLSWLATSCRQQMTRLPGLSQIRPELDWLAQRYAELQSLKHAPDAEGRAPGLEAWANRHNTGRWPVTWWEFAAATGSTLGVFSLLGEARRPKPSPAQIAGLRDAYFPWIGGLHIMLDYLVDQEEDERGRDFNFVSCYADQAAVVAALTQLHSTGQQLVAALPDAEIHQWILAGLPTFYLADRKASLLPADLRRAVGRLDGPRARWLLPLARLSRSP
ncbi:MAG: DUF2600 family protein [Sulfobacillus sp.]